MAGALLGTAALVAAAACDFPTTTSTTKAGVPSVGSYSPRRFAIDLGGGAIVAEPGAAVGGAFFADAKVPPLLGRVFVDADQAGSVAVISHALWEQRFTSDPGIIGREIVIDDRATTVVGVMPKSFQFPEGARLWVRR
jgi:putative ABC transport system permease protein